ncbi:hypothetical protein [Luteipulveratus mongoliensis]|uniref:Uncharacterized protein n=1 Tax=Luteipulveratus mongoliensis TaxID=571913 RepID=A0A0K1JGM5_9MICO|nr:hypothetical protein [Luteipulveratus mongoliensis]AKU15740.1 hypothetical protein VV02_07565 [Luteipulveratus mongoliensis]
MLRSATGAPLIDTTTDSPRRDLPTTIEQMGFWVDERAVPTVATVAERNTIYAGLGPSDGRLVWVIETKSLYAWTGAGWATIWAASSAWNTAGFFWYSGTSEAALSIGDGAGTCQYSKIGLSTAVTKISMRRGSSSNLGAGNYSWRTPLVMTGNQDWTGTGLVRRANGDEWPCTVVATQNQRVALTFCHNQTRVGSTSFTWVPNDKIFFQLEQEVAPS